jgi:dolichyl-phosphate beta-glucosyltransferase
MNFSNLEISIVIPSKNDEKYFIENFKLLKNYFKNKEWKYEVLLISNGSTVTNLNLIKLIDDDKLKHFSLKESGKGLAIKYGIEKAQYNNILFTDADFSVPITELDKFIHENKLIGDILIGNRRSNHSINKGTPFVRRIVGSAYLLTMRLVLGFKIGDSQCGFKIFRKDDYLKIGGVKFNNFSFDIELLYKLSKIRKIIEIPVNYNHNTDSKVSIIQDSLAMFLDLIRLRIRVK